jgi:hypothetical protein
LIEQYSKEVGKENSLYYLRRRFCIMTSDTSFKDQISPILDQPQRHLGKWLPATATPHEIAAEDFESWGFEH